MVCDLDWIVFRLGLIGLEDYYKDCMKWNITPVKSEKHMTNEKTIRRLSFGTLCYTR